MMINNPHPSWIQLGFRGWGLNSSIAGRLILLAAVILHRTAPN